MTDSKTVPSIKGFDRDLSCRGFQFEFGKTYSVTGDNEGATASGDNGAATASGNNGAAMASGYNGKVCGGDGCALFLVERDNDLNIVAVWAGIAGRDSIKPNTFYRLVNGKPEEVER